ncbi:MAG: winged helix-turn-helix transcriptional regulator [Methanomassiliicoccales archaeon]|nr:winged helix-turn-helix transcriptional regulator [Methanomassiliicoccales archaeon]
MSGEATEEMAKAPTDLEIKKQILLSLSEFYPLKVDEVVLLSAVRRSDAGGSADQISKNIQSLVGEGRVEESKVEAFFGNKETYRFRITSEGIESLRSLYSDKKSLSILQADIESRIADTYELLKTDMKDMIADSGKIRQELEMSIEGLNKRIDDLSEGLATIKESVDRYAEIAEGERVKEEHLILRILTEDERKIYGIILEADGEMLQRDLVARTKMSNAKVSRVVDRLESRGILTKERHGWTNRLRIKVKP